MELYANEMYTFFMAGNEDNIKEKSHEKGWFK